MNISKAVEKIKSRAVSIYTYCVSGVWSDMRNTAGVKFVKTMNLSVRAFLDGDIQSKACAMTYRTVLALVPALALIFAIGRGFGLGDIIKRELIERMGSQHQLLERAFEFVDSYLDKSSEGVFVGVGIVLLLYTLVSILGSVERAFNDIWGIKTGRSIWRKITDYLAIFIVLPIFMICSSGITVFLSTALESVFPSEWVSPLLTVILDVASLLLIWLFFTGLYILVPTTKVKFKNAFMAGIFAGTAFLILQWLFISGQIYVSKYNAIYGSVAFLPLFLIWLQLVWVICLTGGVLCYASQNIFRFSFSNEIEHISNSFRLKTAVAIMTVVVHEYLKGNSPTKDELAKHYSMPPRLVSRLVDFMIDAGLLLRVVVNPKVEVYGYAPALDASTITVADVIKRIRRHGASNFVSGFSEHFSRVISSVDKAESAMLKATSDTLIKDLG